MGVDKLHGPGGVPLASQVVTIPTSLGNNAFAHAGSRARVTSMGGLYDAATLRAPQELTMLVDQSFALSDLHQCSPLPHLLSSMMGIERNSQLQFSARILTEPAGGGWLLQTTPCS